jgi:hypothetical protein
MVRPLLSRLGSREVTSLPALDTDLRPEYSALRTLKKFSKQPYFVLSRPAGQKMLGTGQDKKIGYRTGQDRTQDRNSCPARITA